MPRTARASSRNRRRAGGRPPGWRWPTRHRARPRGGTPEDHLDGPPHRPAGVRGSPAAARRSPRRRAPPREPLATAAVRPCTAVSSRAAAVRSPGGRPRWRGTRPARRAGRGGRRPPPPCPPPPAAAPASTRSASTRSRSPPRRRRRRPASRSPPHPLVRTADGRRSAIPSRVSAARRARGGSDSAATEPALTTLPAAPDRVALMDSNVARAYIDYKAVLGRRHLPHQGLRRTTTFGQVCGSCGSVGVWWTWARPLRCSLVSWWVGTPSSTAPRRVAYRWRGPRRPRAGRHRQEPVRPRARRVGDGARRDGAGRAGDRPRGAAAPDEGSAARRARLGIRPGDDLTPFVPTLAVLVPEWGEPTAARRLPPGARRGGAAAAVAPPAERTATLVIDDLQWADPESLAVLEYVVDNLAGRPSCSSSRCATASPAREATWRTPWSVAVWRPTWSCSRSRRTPSPLARSCLDGGPLAAEAVAALVRGSEGVPFLVEELLATAVRSGWDTIADDVPGSVPTSVELRLERSAGARSPAAHRRRAAGPIFDWTLAARVADSTTTTRPSCSGAACGRSSSTSRAPASGSGTPSPVTPSWPAPFRPSWSSWPAAPRRPRHEELLGGSGACSPPSWRSPPASRDLAAALLAAGGAWRAPSTGALASADALATRARDAGTGRWRDGRRRALLEVARLAGHTDRAGSARRGAPGPGAGSRRAGRRPPAARRRRPGGRPVGSTPRPTPATPASSPRTTLPAVARADALAAQAAIEPVDTEMPSPVPRWRLDGARDHRPAGGGVRGARGDRSRRARPGPDGRGGRPSSRPTTSPPRAGLRPVAAGPCRSSARSTCSSPWTSTGSWSAAHGGGGRCAGDGGDRRPPALRRPRGAWRDRALPRDGAALRGGVAPLGLSTLPMASSCRGSCTPSGAIGPPERVVAAASPPVRTATTSRLDGRGQRHPRSTTSWRETCRGGAGASTPRWTCSGANPGAAYVFPGEWALLRTVLDDDGDAARAEVAALPLDTPVSRRCSACGRGGRRWAGPARTTRRKRGSPRSTKGSPPPRTRSAAPLRTCVARRAAAHADGWGDPIAWLRRASPPSRRPATTPWRPAAAPPQGAGRAGPAQGPRATPAPCRPRSPPSASPAARSTCSPSSPRGATNREVGERLFISTRTVDKHVERLLQKTGTTRAGLADLASRRGCVRSPAPLMPYRPADGSGARFPDDASCPTRTNPRSPPCTTPSSSAAAAPAPPPPCCWPASGRRVLVVDRATFPSDVLSGHTIQPAGVARLARWGLLDKVRATGVPFTSTVRFDFGHVVLEGDPVPVDGIDNAVCIRRTDPRHAAHRRRRRGGRRGAPRRDASPSCSSRTAGSSASAATTAPAPRRGAGRRSSSAPTAPNSFVARSVRPTAYNEHPATTVAVYSYFRGLDLDGIELYSRPGRFFVATPTNDGLTFVAVQVPADEAPRYQGRSPRPSVETIAEVPHLADRVHAHRAGRAVPVAPACPTASSASPPGPAGRWSATPATTRTRSRPRACSTPSATPSCLAEAIDGGLGGDLDGELARLPGRPRHRASSRCTR